MPASLLAVCVDCRDPRQAADFWASVLDSKAVERNPGEFLVDTREGALYFMAVPEPKVGKNRLHLDLVTEDGLDREVERLTGLGANLVEVRHDPAELPNPDTWAVLEDPEGNVFCVSSIYTVTGWTHTREGGARG